MKFCLFLGIVAFRLCFLLGIIVMGHKAVSVPIFVHVMMRTIFS